MSHPVKVNFSTSGGAQTRQQCPHVGECVTNRLSARRNMPQSAPLPLATAAATAAAAAPLPRGPLASEERAPLLAVRAGAAPVGAVPYIGPAACSTDRRVGLG